MAQVVEEVTQVTEEVEVTQEPIAAPPESKPKRERKPKVAEAVTETREFDGGETFGGETTIAHADAPYSRGIAWTQAGLDVANTFTSEEALAAAKLDWEVALADVINVATGKPIENYHAVYRTDNGRTLGMSRGSYTPLQNREMFAWTDELIKDGVAQYVSAGSFLGGKRVWLIMQMPEGATIAGEEYRQFLMCVTGHDLDAAFRAFTTSMRVYCWNTFLMAIRGQDNGIRIHHHSGIHNRLSQAAQTMRIMTEQQRRLSEWLERAAETQLKRGQYDKIITGIFGDVNEDSHAAKRRQVELFREVWTIESGKNGETAYSAFNTVTGFADHKKQVQGKNDPQLQAERRLKSIVDGQARDFKIAGLNVIADITKLPTPRTLVSAN